MSAVNGVMGVDGVIVAPAEADLLLRAVAPATEAIAYLNTGTAGPLLAPVADAMARAAEAEVATGRVGRAASAAFSEQQSELRATLAGLFGADEDEIALTHHTTEGMNIATWGLDWQAGDRVVTTSLEHGGGLLPLYQLHRRFGVMVDFADIGLGGTTETLDGIAAQLDSPAKLLVLSHVTYGTGAALPLTEIVELAHARGVLVAADGAQSAGAMPLDLHATGVDFYSFPGQKWLCGPEGTGGLYVRRDRLDELASTFTGFRSVDHDAYSGDDPDSLVPAPGARRYEVGSLYRPGIIGLLAAASWHAGEGKRLEVAARISELAEFAMVGVAELPGAELLTPAANHAGLVCFTLAGIDPAATVADLATQGVSIRSIPDNGALRLSCGFFNTRDEVTRALSLVAHSRTAT